MSKAQKPVIVVIVGVLVALCGCQVGGESTRALVKARQEEWAQQVSTLRRQEANARGRFGSGAEPAISASRLRVQAVLEGSRQSLADVDVQIRASGERLERALATGGEAATKALEEESGRVSDNLRLIREQLDATEREIEAIRHGEGRKETDRVN